MYKDTSLGKIMDAVVITAGATSSADPINIDGAIEIAVVADVTFSASATGEAIFNFYTAMDESYSVYSEKSNSDYAFTAAATDMNDSNKVLISPSNFNVQARKRMILSVKNTDDASITVTVYATKASV